MSGLEPGSGSGLSGGTRSGSEPGEGSGSGLGVGLGRGIGVDGGIFISISAEYCRLAMPYSDARNQATDERFPRPSE